MDESTTTGGDVQDTGAAPAAQPVADGFDTAASQPAEPQQPQAPAQPEAETPTTEPPADDNSTWLQKKGIDPSSPEAVSKLAEMARNAEKKMHESTTKASELERSLQQDIQTAASNGDDDLVKQLATEVQSLKLTQSVNSFFNTGSDEQIAEKKSFEPAMAAMVTENPTLGQLVKVGYVTYDQLLAMAKGSDSNREQQLKQDGGREALERVADKQQARSVTGVATTSALPDTDAKDPFLEGFNNPY